jgi:hypothetical protein
MRPRLLAPASAVLALFALADVARADVASLRAELGSALGAMVANAARLRRALHEARLHGDRERVACASDGLSQADVALRTARESARAAQDALARGDEDAARAYLTAVLAARASSRAATASVDACFAFGTPEPPEVTTVRWHAPAPPRGGR